MDLKAGFKTTEFWLSFAATTVGAIISSGIVTHEPILKGLGLVSALLAALGYTAVRGYVKSR